MDLWLKMADHSAKVFQVRPKLCSGAGTVVNYQGSPWFLEVQQISCWIFTTKTQQTDVYSVLSNIFHFRHDVPEGSCLGPLLCNIYSSKIFDIVGHHLP